jgi:sugar O-acyltransferase (sialic acid O-acetyltransferase NeuD family)
MRDVVIFGSGQVAEVMHYYITHESDRKVAAFTLDAAYLKEASHLGLPVVPFEEIETAFAPSTYEMFVAISYRQVNKARERKVEEAEAKGYRLISHVSPRAVVWSGFEAKANTFIMENNVIQPYVRIGKNVIMWSGNHVGHHTEIGDNCFIASHVVVSGSVKVGRNTFIGVNATIRDNITIGASNVIGAAALILENTPDEAVYLGRQAELARVPSSRLRKI